jgi:uncharacterized membrane protein
VGDKTSEQIIFGILSYLGILVLIPLLAKKDDPWVQEHAKQGLAFLILWVIVWVIGIILMFIPFLGWAIDAILWLLMLVIFIIEVIRVATGSEPWTIPVFGPMAKTWKI